MIKILNGEKNTVETGKRYSCIFGKISGKENTPEIIHFWFAFCHKGNIHNQTEVWYSQTWIHDVSIVDSLTLQLQAH